jgi:hypothetical protein
MTLGSDWVTQLRAALDAGADPEALFVEFKMRNADDEEQRRFAPIPRDAHRFLEAYEANDAEALRAWTVDGDGETLTSQATRMLLDAWEREDAQSS